VVSVETLVDERARGDCESKLAMAVGYASSHSICATTLGDRNDLVPRADFLGAIFRRRMRAVDFHLRDQQQSGRWTGTFGWGAVDEWWDGRAGPIHGDAPKVSKAKGEGLRAGVGRVVQVVVVLGEVVQETRVVLPPVAQEQFGAGFGAIHAPGRLGVEQGLAGGPKVRAQPGLGLHGRAVHMEGKNVGRDRSSTFIAARAVDDVESRVELALQKSALVLEQQRDRRTSGRASRKLSQPIVLERDNAFSLSQ
jgi:hypothetical protein